MILIDTQKEEFNKLKHVRIFSKVENENRFNGNLLVIGLGGVGGKVVTALKRMMMGSISTRVFLISALLFSSENALLIQLSFSQCFFPQIRFSFPPVIQPLHPNDKVCGIFLQDIQYSTADRIPRLQPVS